MYSIIYVMKFDFCSLKLLSLSDNIYLTASEKKNVQCTKTIYVHICKAASMRHRLFSEY